MAWKLGLHILFHLISMVPLQTVGIRSYSKLFAQQSNGKLDPPCYIGFFADLDKIVSVILICAGLYVIRSLADPVLHIAWEPTLRASCFSRCGRRKLGEDSTGEGEGNVEDGMRNRRKTADISSSI